MKHPLDPRQPGDPLRKIGGDPTDMRHAHAHRLDAAQGKLAIVRRNPDADHPHCILEASVECDIGHRYRSKQQVRMAADIFGKGIHREIDTVSKRLEEQRRGPGIIASGQYPTRPGSHRDRRDILELHRRRSGQFHPDQPRMIVDQSRDVRANQRVIHVMIDSAFCEIVRAESANRWVGRVGDQDFVTGAEDRHEDDRDRALAGRRDDRALRPLEGR